MVFDRFHVERLASDAVDDVPREEQRRRGSMKDNSLKKLRYASLKHPKRLKPGEKRRLAKLRRQNRALDRAYELKEYLATILRASRARRCQSVARRVAGVGDAVPPGTVREAAADDPQAPGRDPRLPRHEDDQRSGGGNQQQTTGHRPPRLTTSTRTAPSSRCCSLCCGGIELAPPLPTRV